jgi:hypothetical protein
MNVRRLTTSAVFLLLAFAIYPVSTLSKHNISEALPAPARLRVGQTIAVSDFDADGLLDEARLDGSSWRRSVGVLLSGTGKRSFLHFQAVSANHGSLFAQDLDNDGATDLIWTNPFHAGDIVVWRGDGNGRFERVDPSDYRGDFALCDWGVTQPDGANQETAINFETDALDQPITQKHLDQSATPVSSSYPERVATSSPELGQPDGRAPPSLLY